MTIRFYQSLSENNALNKTFSTDFSEYNGEFRNDVNILNPVFTIDTSEDLSRFNYCEISAFHRKYFITNIELLRTNVYQITAKVDVLETYKNEINSLAGITKRQANQWNGYINDDRVMKLNYSRIQTKKFPAGFSKNLNLILVTAGNGERGITNNGN